MKLLFLLPVFILYILQINAQNLDKIRVMCLDEVNISDYEGELSKKELQNQIAALGFRYIQDAQIKYHDELIVYDCKTGSLKFTAVFDENRLIEEFVLYESKVVPAKKIRFSKNAKSDYVDLKLSYKGQEIAAFPVGKTEIFKDGKLTQTITFDDKGGLPLVTYYDSQLKRTSEGKAHISGYIQKDWETDRVGEWKYFENGQLASMSTFDKNGKESIEKLYTKGTLVEKNSLLPNGTIEVTHYYENGNIKDNGLEKSKSKTGTWQYFDISGNLQEKVEYAKGLQTRLISFDKEENILQQLDLVKKQSKLQSRLGTSDLVYQAETYYPSGKLKSIGYQSADKRIGVFEFYNENGQLSQISEFDNTGDKINTVDAETYATMQEKEKEIYRELLVAKTTHPLNIGLLQHIEILTDSLKIDFDSLMLDYKYKTEFENHYSKLKSQTSSFGKLSNKISWYKSVLSSAEEFNNETWAYSHDLHEIELALEKKWALEKIQEMKSNLKEEYTSSKKTLFGRKIMVKNDQEEVYESITEEIYPTFRKDIKSSTDKYDAKETVVEFRLLLQKGSSIIDEPNERIQDALKSTKSVQDKKQLILTLK